MKRIGKEPRLLPNIMEAIVNLKEKNGSTQKQILEHVGDVLKKNKDSCRNLTIQVKRAIDHGIKTGLVKQSRGKFLLGLDKKDYTIFRKFRNLPLEGCSYARRGRRSRRGRKGRRGRRRSRRSRRRRGRRHALSEGDASDDAASDSDLSLDSAEEPGDKGGRRRRRRRRRRSRRGRRRGRRGRKSQMSSENTDSAESTRKNSSEDLKHDKNRQDNDKQEFQQKPSRSASRHVIQRPHQEEEDVECGNPECVCGIKADMPHQDNYYNDSYLN